MKYEKEFIQKNIHALFSGVLFIIRIYSLFIIGFRVDYNQDSE